MRFRVFASAVLVLSAMYLFAQAGEQQGGKQGRRPVIIGHRGLLKHAPEDTLSNFRACFELRLSIELDVRRTKDGQLVAIHDATLDRTTNGRGKVADFTVVELQKLDAGSWFDPAFKGERIPSLDEVFALLARYPHPRILIAVDLKEANQEAESVRLAMKHKVLDQLVFIGLARGSADVRRKLRKTDAKAPVACMARSPEEITAAIKDPDSSWVYVRFLPSHKDVDRIHTAGKRILLSGPKVSGIEPKNWKQAADLGIDAVLTDYPLELANLLRTKP